MKKFLCLTLGCLTFLINVFYFALIPKNITASAASTYLRVVDDSTVFYANANENTPLFYLPYTYYVKSLGVAGNFLHVECYGVNGEAALDGYVLSNALFDDGLTVTNPYVTLTITTSTTSILYADNTLTTPVQYLFAERNLRYFGSYVCDQKNVFYVSYNGRLGYVKESDVYPFAIPNHPNELTFLPPETPPVEEVPKTPETQKESDEFFSLKMIIIICLLFSGIVALFVAIKQKPKHQVAAGYYDENDYE